MVPFLQLGHKQKCKQGVLIKANSSHVTMSKFQNYPRFSFLISVSSEKWHFGSNDTSPRKLLLSGSFPGRYPAPHSPVPNVWLMLAVANDTQPPDGVFNALVTVTSSSVCRGGEGWWRIWRGKYESQHKHQAQCLGHSRCSTNINWI